MARSDLFGILWFTNWSYSGNSGKHFIWRPYSCLVSSIISLKIKLVVDTFFQPFCQDPLLTFKNLFWNNLKSKTQPVFVAKTHFLKSPSGVKLYPLFMDNQSKFSRLCKSDVTLKELNQRHIQKLYFCLPGTNHFYLVSCIVVNRFRDAHITILWQQHLLPHSSPA